MGRIFLSHSSVDNAAAAALQVWLDTEGWNDVFLDFDPDRGISAGQRWSRALAEAANRCEAVIFLLTKSWLSSEWCQRELDYAIRLNKQIFGVIYDDISRRDLPSKLTATWQVINLASGNDHVLFQPTVPGSTKDANVTFSKAGLISLKSGLQKAGLDTRFFAWPPVQDPNRPPWRGLSAMEAEDAGIFFGREAPTIEVLDQLRGMLEIAPSNMMVILGASGAGKSSFLKAGLWPRLARDDRHFLPLPVMRPERAAISGPNGFVRVLHQALADRGVAVTRAAVKEAVAEGSQSVAPLLNTLVERVDPDQKSPAIVISIDQAEELFLPSGQSESLQLLSVLAGLLQSDAGQPPVAGLPPVPNADPAARPPRVLLLLTIRSDAYEPLQTAAALEGHSQKVFNLTPMPAGAWSEIIEGPVRRMQQAGRKLSIEPALVARLLNDLPGSGGKDTLPLLSFALERLYVDYGGDGNLTQTEYDKFGGIAGAIQAAIDGALRSADTDPQIPADLPSRMKLLRMAFIPWLAGFDPGNEKPRRNVARWNDIPESSRALVEHLVDARLLSTDVSESGERTIEPTHEALLRQWGELRDWLQEDAALLTTLTAIQQASRDWISNGKRSGWLTHQTGRLEDAERLYTRPDLAAKLNHSDREYLAACRSAEDGLRNRELEEARKLANAQKLLAEANATKIQQQKSVVRRTRLGLAAASLLALLAASLAFWGFRQSHAAIEQAVAAARSATAAEAANARLAGSLGENLASSGQTSEAILLLLQAVRHFDAGSITEEMKIAFQSVVKAAFLVRRYDIPKDAEGVAGPNAMYLFDPASKDILRVDGKKDPSVILRGNPSDATIDKIGYVKDIGLVVVRADDTIERIRLPAGSREPLGKLTELKQPTGRQYGDEDSGGRDIEIHANGVVVVSNSYQQGSDVYGTTVRLFDTRSRASLSYESGDAPEYLIDADGTSYLRLTGEDKESLLKITTANGKLAIAKPAVVTDARLKDLLASTCIVDAGATPTKDVVKKMSASDTTTPGAQLLCAASSNGMTFSFFYPTSAGGAREDTLMMPKETDQGLRDLFWPDGDSPSSEMFSWVGLSPSGTYIGAVLNRVLFIHSTDGSGTSNEKRFSGDPGAVMFLNDEEIAVVDPESVKVEVHRLDTEKPMPLFVAPNEDDVMASKTKLVPLNISSCLNQFKTETDDVFDNSVSLPDGRRLTFKTSESENDAWLEVASKGQNLSTEKLSLGGASCTVISPDGKRALRTLADRVEIVDLDKVIAGGKWTDSTLATLKQTVNSAYFIGNDNAVITTDGSYSAYKWSCDTVSKACNSAVIFKGDKKVVFAEPNHDASLLILMELIGEGDLRGFAYSTTAKKESLDLGIDYKWLGLAFTSDGDVAVSKHSTLTNLIRLPPFEMLKSAAEASLADNCQPKERDDYATSRCWPTNF